MLSYSSEAIRRRDFLLWMVAAGGVGAARSNAFGQDAELKFEVGTPYLVASLKTDGSGMYAPHAFRGSNGAIYLGYYPWPDALVSDPYPATLLRSIDDGITWHSLGERPNFGYLFGETRDGAVWAIDCWKGRRPGHTFEAQRFTSKDHVAPEIVSTQLLGFKPNQEPFWHLNRFVRASDRSLVAVTYAVTQGETQWMLDGKPLPAPTHIVCLASEDEARTWRQRAVVAIDRTPAADLGPSRIGISEPFVEALADGRLLCIYRRDTLGREMLQTWSSDAGRTWTEPVSTRVVGVDPCLLRLEGGPVLCSYGRPEVKLMYSLNGGVTWKGRTSLYSPTAAARAGSSTRTAWSHAYTSMVAVSSDRVLYFFDIHEHPMPWSGRLPTGAAPPENRANSIFAVSIRVTRH